MLTAILSFLGNEWKIITAAATVSWFGNGLWSLLKSLYSTRKDNLKEHLLRFDEISEKLKTAAKNYWSIQISEGGNIDDLESEVRISIFSLNTCLMEETPWQLKSDNEKIISLCAQLNDTFTNPDFFATGLEHEPSSEMYESGCKILIKLRVILLKRW